MRTFIFVVMLLANIVGADAQSVEKRLMPFHTDKGEAYFIGNRKLGEHSKGIKKFMFDMTYISHNDSLTMNFTVVSPRPDDIATLTVSNGTLTSTASAVQLLYHEAKGSNYVVRTTARLSYKDIKQLYTSDSPIVFTFDDKGGTTNTATYSDGEWSKERALFEKIFYTINI